jgi:hypothetical protein
MAMSDQAWTGRCTCGNCEPVTVVAPAGSRLFPTYTVTDGIGHLSGYALDPPEPGPPVPLVPLNLDGVRWGDVASGRIDEEGGRR